MCGASRALQTSISGCNWENTSPTSSAQLQEALWEIPSGWRPAQWDHGWAEQEVTRRALLAPAGDMGTEAEAGGLKPQEKGRHPKAGSSKIPLTTTALQCCKGILVTIFLAQG